MRGSSRHINLSTGAAADNDDCIATITLLIVRRLSADERASRATIDVRSCVLMIEVAGDR